MNNHINEFDEKARTWDDTLDRVHRANAVAVGIIHWLSRKQLFLISEFPDKAAQRKLRIWWWDIVFYATFGVAVTSSVKVAGVLLIFSLLIIPAIAALISTSGTVRRVVFGWGIGLVGCVLGLEVSLRGDFAAGPSIITTLLAIMLVCAGVVPIITSFKKRSEKQSSVEMN